MLCGKIANNCWSHETFPAWKQTVSFTAHSSLIYLVHWKMSKKRKEREREKKERERAKGKGESNHNNPLLLPVYKCFECHNTTFVITQLIHMN